MIEEGKTGWLFDSTSSASLAQAIGRAAGIEPRAFAAMSRNCFTSAQKFHASNIGTRHVKYFYFLLDGGDRDLAWTP
jgi:hypothetical protein